MTSPTTTPPAAPKTPQEALEEAERLYGSACVDFGVDSPEAQERLRVVEAARRAINSEA